MPLTLVKYYTAEIISALELMHSKGMIHRDLKPENILITDDWHLKIVRLFHL
jgi:3-phosphoinositide dependent protein kinase-1